MEIPQKNSLSNIITKPLRELSPEERQEIIPLIARGETGLRIRDFLQGFDLFNDQGAPLDFTDHPFLLDIYRDMSPVQAIMKCSQIGASTMLNIKALWLAAAREMDIIYSLPSASDAHDFVSSKTNRLIANTPIFRRWIKDKDSVEQKRVLKNVIYFRGTRTKQAALSIPADLYIADEVDRSDEETVRQYLSRLHHSRYGWRWYLSNPSVIGHGVSEWWERSDQKHWFVKCDCGKGEYHGWQFMTMDNLMGSPLYFGCRFCGKELNRKEGRWIKKYRDRREVSGYWLSLLMAPWVTAAQIMERKNDMTAEQFSNFVLGEPYTGVKNTLTRQSFFQNLTPAVNSQEGRIIIGVDTGEAINLVAGNKEGLFYYSKTDDYAELTSLLNRWPNSIAIIDQGGDIIGPRKLREKFRNRVYLCFFARDRKNDELVRWNDDEGTVIADRNKTIQLVVDEFSERRIPVNGTEAEWLDFYLEWARMYRTVEKSETGPPVYEWHKPTSGRADYPFCFSGDTLVKTDHGDVEIRNIKAGDFVLTRRGYKRVSWSGITNPRKQLYEFITDRGSVFATRDHRFFINGRGFDTVEAGDKIVICEWSEQSLTGSSLQDIRTRLKEIIGFIMNPRKSLMVKEKPCIDICSAPESEKYRKDLWSTIKTAILSITISPILNLCLSLSTSLSTLRPCGKMPTRKKGKRCCRRRVKRNMSGTDRRRGGKQCRNVPRTSIAESSSAKSAVKEKRLKVLWPSVVRSSAGESKMRENGGWRIRPIGVIGIRKAGVDAVYDLEVEDVHEFFANGFLVHNCAVYWRIGMDKFKEDRARFITPSPAGGKVGSPAIDSFTGRMV